MAKDAAVAFRSEKFDFSPPFFPLAKGSKSFPPSFPRFIIFLRPTLPYPLMSFEKSTTHNDKFFPFPFIKVPN